MDTESVIRDLMEALTRSGSGTTGRVTVSRTLIYQAKLEIENLAHRVAVLETEAAMSAADCSDAPSAKAPTAHESSTPDSLPEGSPPSDNGEQDNEHLPNYVSGKSTRHHCLTMHVAPLPRSGRRPEPGSSSSET